MTSDPSHPGPADPDQPRNPVHGLARIALNSAVRPWLRLAEQALDAAEQASVQVGEVVEAAANPFEAARGIRIAMVDQARRALGIDDLAAALRDRPAALTVGVATDGLPLPEQGAALLARSASAAPDDGVHPAFGAILAQLAPDEARILRLLASDGPQPVIHLRAATGLGRSGRDVALNRTMLSSQAGLRHPERIDVYLDNLDRLRLTRADDEEAADGQTYELLSVQPVVTEARQAATNRGVKTRADRGRILLTALGEEFYMVCFSIAASAAAGSAAHPLPTTLDRGDDA